jgi:hypothetical protein
MGVRKVKLPELNGAVRSFLDEVRKEEPIMVEDEARCAIFGVIP